MVFFFKFLFSVHIVLSVFGIFFGVHIFYDSPTYLEKKTTIHPYKPPTTIVGDFLALYSSIKSPTGYELIFRISHSNLWEKVGRSYGKSTEYWYKIKIPFGTSASPTCLSVELVGDKGQVSFRGVLWVIHYSK